MSEYKKTALVLGAGGFIGSHMVKRLRKEGYWVRGVDLKQEGGAVRGMGRAYMGAPRKAKIR